VRSFVFVLGLILCLQTASAQEQERTLVDRLLKPNMELQDKTHDKKFIADHGGAVDKRASVGSFYVQEKKNAKKFAATREAPAREFRSQNFRGTKEAAGAKPQREIPNAKRDVPTGNVRDVRKLPDSTKIVDSRDYSGKRQFLERGKSQKSLDRKNPPMTIDQVRELLNKSK
jgi:hypothetical protein